MKLDIKMRQKILTIMKAEGEHVKINKNYLTILGSIVLIIIMVIFINEYQYEYQTKEMEYYAEKTRQCMVHGKDEENCINSLKIQLERIGFKEVSIQLKEQEDSNELSLFANLKPTKFDEVLNRKLKPRGVKYEYNGKDARIAFNYRNKSEPHDKNTY